MTNISRRNLLKASAAGAAGVAAAGVSAKALAKSNGKRVVIVGGGIGGATAAQYLKKMDSTIDVTIVEYNKDYYTCFMSNEVIGGNRDIESIHFTYEKLAAKGIKVVYDTVTDIDAKGQVVKTKGGKSLAYDRCIVSPGVDYKWEAIEGFTPEVAATTIPHAWKAGPQTKLLRKQLEEMKDGGTVVVVAPPNPFRCPPGPYERVSQIAAYLKENKPKSKIVVLDPKKKFSKFGLFMDGWKRHYGYGTDNSMITWINSENGGTVSAVDVASKTVTAAAGKFKGDVVNIIPPQKAGSIAFKAGLTNDSGWCPIDHKTFESTIHKNIHVVGDSSVAAPMPKSGYAANSQAKVCAAAVASLLNGTTMIEPSWVNTCYSVIAPGQDGISVAMVYKYEGGKIVKVKGSGGLTGAYDPELRKREVLYAHSWFENITADTFG
ncbi:FAD-dependent oxidoreductase [Thiomicrorhabdus sp. 6S2-11]|uniref:FAD-dependent oxidoreductase n=1 Tax=Thiomicrorhabdus marina TaxID=2818442 RepID=A0ABS3Q576_9GAMM|nr:NAD(P)/FAD-dependent oxidoreductase [Thiomicrorhabdus marina]MBO1926995.1 FAD-dependent oxidoreductase [Thiomicrorhabdus marina]